MNRTPLALLVLFTLVACGPSAGTETDGSGGGSTTSEPADSTGTEGASASSTSAAGPTSTADDTGSTGPDAPACEAPADAPRCVQTECSQRWDYDCPECESQTAAGCFWNDFECDYPMLECASDSPCPRVVVDGEEWMTLEDQDAARCVLTSLRDGVPGAFHLEWGIMFDCCWTTEIVYATGDGNVFAEWQLNGFGSDLAGTLGRTGVLPLQPTSYFDDCLADPTDATLIECLVALRGSSLDSVPEGYVPPFTTGECVSLDFTCP